MMKAMERLINEELEKKNDDEEVLKKVNQVADAARELSEELRRKVSPEEICANYEAITMDDVEAAMQISACLLYTSSSEQIACINFLFYIIKAAVITVGNDRMGSCFELFKIIDNFTAEECITVL